MILTLISNLFISLISTINISDVKEITISTSVDSNFILEESIQFIDEHGVDISDSMTYTGQYDISKEGTYIIEFTFITSDNEVITKNGYIQVNTKGVNVSFYIIGIVILSISGIFMNRTTKIGKSYKTEKFDIKPNNKENTDYFVNKY